MEKTIIAILLVTIVMVAFTSLGAVILMLLWNWIMPTLFGLPAITFWMAIGISLLFTILFKSNVNINKN